MSAEDRRFYGVLSLVFGPLFILGGWLAAFTDVGAVLVLAGVAMLLASPVLLRSLKVVPFVAIAIVVGLLWPLLIVAGSG